jgi:diaminohydroxyphosphoribosylaminopyrimidine deaminase/5-amino-6-(5-phosphoribosylamino)uracil reductase
VFVCCSAPAAARARQKVERLESRGIVVLRFPTPGGRLVLRDILGSLYKFSIGSVLVEGGSSIFAQVITEKLADELSIFVAPRILGEGVPVFAEGERQVPPFDAGSAFTTRRVGKDILFTMQFRQGR